MKGLPNPPVLEKGCLLLSTSRDILAEGLPCQRSYKKSQELAAKAWMASTSPLGSRMLIALC